MIVLDYFKLKTVAALGMKLPMKWKNLTLFSITVPNRFGRI